MSNCEKRSCNEGSCSPVRYSQGFGQNGLGLGNSGVTRDTVKGYETDSSLYIDYPNATLVYKSEKHTDQITGQQLGSIININDLRDVDLDYNFNAMCGEFIYHKYGECGDGCRSLEDAWNMFSIDQDGAKQNGIQYVRGANAYGCPIYLDTPSNQLQYWYAGWTPTGQFTYYQPVQVGKLPEINDDPVVMSQDPTTKQPLVGTIPLKCLFNNLVGNLSFPMDLGFQVLQATPDFKYYPDNMSGKFIIEWNDWRLDYTTHVGSGKIYGQIMWKFSFDYKTGNMTYTTSKIHYDKVTYVTDKGVTNPNTRFHLTLKSVNPQTGAQAILPPFNAYEFTGNTNWSETINQDVVWNTTITITPGQEFGPMNFLYLLNHGVEGATDDEGYLNVTLSNRLDWENCW